MTQEEQDRRGRLEALRVAGTNPYPSDTQRTHTVADFLAAFDQLGEKEATLVGRLRTVRAHGGLTFAHVEDGTGRVQLVFHKDVLGEDAYEGLSATVDVGDFVQATGAAFTTKKGEHSLDVHAYRLLSKSLLPLPEKWHGLEDVETRFRFRELDLIANASVREVFRTRSVIVQRIRTFLEAEGYMEVETPILQPIPGGANARPFVTHHHALDTDLYLRVAPELYLKRLIVGGFERVFELGRSFRNEGIDHQHNPEFTSVEAYGAYGDYHGLMDLMDRLIPDVVQRACGSLQVEYDGKKVDFTSPYPRVRFFDAIKKHAKADLRHERDRKELVKVAKRLGGAVHATDSVFAILDEIFKKSVRVQIADPVFITDYPVELTPLAKRKHDEPDLVERAVLVAAGLEVMNGFSELNDPLDQEERFREQETARAQGDAEAQRMDDAYIISLKHGLPPTVGWAIGIDRFTMLLTGQPNIKEVILFPTLRPKK